jgi:hypothetical protein
MDNLLNIAFEAHHAELNHHRRYEITVGRDLFDEWVVTIHYGRSGCAGRELAFGGGQPEELRRVIRNSVLRRLSAPRRIGCDYKLTELSAATLFDIDFWLPSDVLVQLTTRF